MGYILTDLGVEGVMVEQFLNVVGWPSHSRRVCCQQDWDVLAGSAALLRSKNESVIRTKAPNNKPDRKSVV